MYVAQVSRDKVFRHVLRRLDGIVTSIVPVPKDDMSSTMACSDVLDDPLARLFWFVSPDIES